MRILNTTMLTPRNLLVIAIVSIAVHALARPVFRMVDGIPDND